MKPAIPNCIACFARHFFAVDIPAQSEIITLFPMFLIDKPFCRILTSKFYMALWINCFKGTKNLNGDSELHGGFSWHLHLLLIFKAKMRLKYMKARNPLLVKHNSQTDINEIASASTENDNIPLGLDHRLYNITTSRANTQPHGIVHNPFIQALSIPRNNEPNPVPR